MEDGANTFEKIAREWYAKQDFALKHGKNVLSRLEKDAFKVIGALPITDIRPKDIVAMLQKIEARGALNVVQRINQYCISIFNYAIMSARCEMNPAQACIKLISPPPIRNREHLKEADLPAFVLALKDAKQSKMTLATKLLAFTFLRPGELRNALWTDVDIEKALLCIPAKRMKIARDHLVPLSKQALATLAELRELTGRSAYLLPGQKLTKPVSDVALINTVRKLTKDKATPHGFRHTASTILHEQGYNTDHIEMQLAHVEENKVRGTYNKALYLEPRTAMLQDWADYLDQQLKKAKTRKEEAHA
jgi:integrase